MRNRKINYVLVGAFTLAMISALVLSIALLTGRTGAVDTYYAVYDNVSGVDFGTRVLYEGYHIGQVEEVVPVEQNGRMRFRIDMSVLQGWRIPKDSVAQVETGGLLAAVTIGIRAGESQDILASGSEIISGVSTSLFGAVSQMAGEVSDITRTGIRPLLANVSEQVEYIGKLLHEDVTGIVSDIRVVTSTVRDQTPQMVSNMGNMFSASNAENMSNALSNLNSGTDNFSALTNEVKGIVTDNHQNIDSTLSDLSYSMKAVARRIDVILRNLESTSLNMQEFSRQIRLNPGLLLGGSPPRDEAAKPAAASKEPHTSGSQP